MKLFKKVKDLQFYLQNANNTHLSKGFVPTMGALHNGHISLLELSKNTCDISICSIYVNPTQFNNQSDFDKYPVTVGKDIELLESAGCDILFLPQGTEIYPVGTANLSVYNLGNLETVLEGKYRPGHFQGVCQVVHRLLDIVQPDVMFLGQKDFQQCMVIQKLNELIQSNVKLIFGPTLREKSGLAMSSRNQRLTEQQKTEAVAIYQMLQYIHHHIGSIPSADLCNYAKDYLLQHGFNKVDYVAVADPTTLQPITDIPNHNAVALIAAFIGEIRLIDNMIVKE